MNETQQIEQKALYFNTPLLRVPRHYDIVFSAQHGVGTYIEDEGSTETHNRMWVWHKSEAFLIPANETMPVLGIDVDMVENFRELKK